MQEAGLKPHVQSFSSLVASYVRLGLLSDAISVYQKMVKDGVKPNEVVYGALINGFAEVGRIEEALYYYQLMKNDGVSENQIILTSLIKAYSKGGYLKEAKEIYESLEQMEGGPDIVASNSMISLYTDLRIVSEATVIFDRLQQKGQADAITFASMISLCKNMGMLDEAAEVAEEMKQAGLLTDCASFTKVISCNAANDQLAHCGELLHEMLTREIMPGISTFKVLFTVLKKGGLPIEAIQQLEAAYEKEKTYARQAIIACLFSVVGLHTFAIESYEAFAKAINLDSFAYNVSIFAYAALGHTDKAL